MTLRFSHANVQQAKNHHKVSKLLPAEQQENVMKVVATAKIGDVNINSHEQNEHGFFDTTNEPKCRKMEEDASCEGNE